MDLLRESLVLLESVTERKREAGKERVWLGLGVAAHVLFHITSELWNFLCSRGALQRRGRV